MNMGSDLLPNMDELLASKNGAELSQAISENSTSKSDDHSDVVVEGY